MIHRGMLLVVVVASVAVGAGAGTAVGQSAPDCSQVSYNGDGSEQNPYEVSNVNQLQCINNQSLTANYAQTSDIDASSTSAWNNGSGFDQISKPEYVSGRGRYNGTFDGQGFKIRGLTINRTTEEFVGLFGAIGTAGKVTNASVVNVNVFGNNNYRRSRRSGQGRDGS
jgi:hypothetical protein